MRYPLKEGLNLYTIWTMVAYANEVNNAYPVSKDDWFLSTQVRDLIRWLDCYQDKIKVTGINIDQFTVDYILDGLEFEAMLCRGDTDTTCYSWEYSRATEYLRSKLEEKFKC